MMMKIHNFIRYTQCFLVLATMLIAGPTWAASNFVMTVKSGSYSWQDRTQETAEYDVKYDNNSGTYALGFEKRMSKFAMGGELMHLSSSWVAVDPAALRPKGKLDLNAISFVSRKYFAPIGNFVPFAGAGVGWADVESTYSSDIGGKDREHEDGTLLQLNIGGEWRWESAGLMLELKYINVGISDPSDSIAKDDFPHISGVIGYVGYSMLF